MPTGRADLDALVKVRSVPADEPSFWLRGQDQLAGDAVRDWAARAKDAGVDPAVVEQALQQADAMDAWPTRKLPDAGHLTEDQRKQLTYQHGRRVWADRATSERAADEAWGRQLAREEYAERLEGMARALQAARDEAADLALAAALTARVVQAARTLEFSAYPAHGSGFVCTVDGELAALKAALAALSEDAAPPPLVVRTGSGVEAADA